MILSFVIVTYNSNELIKDCVDSIIKFSDVKSYEIILVDNSDSIQHQVLKKIIAENFGDFIQVIKNESNTGYGSGNNLGIRTAKGRYVAIMNPDVVLTSTFLLESLEKFEKNKNLALLGFKQIGGKNLSFYPKPEYFIPLLNDIITRISNYFDLFSSKYFFISGAFFVVRKDVIIEAGLFDENIFLYGEESDLSNRIRNLEYQIKYDKKNFYIHKINDRGKQDLNSFKRLMDSRIYYFKKFNFNFNLYAKLLKIDILVKKKFHMDFQAKGKIKILDSISK